MDYQTITGPVRIETKVRGSRFIATAMPVSSKEAAATELEKIRKEFWDATHNCYAYRLAPNGTVARSSDDGEPSGTAGRPILSVMEGRALVDLLVVVTRYFGGTKLGAGGLVRAYGDAAGEALDAANVVIVRPTVRVDIAATYDDVGVVRRLIDTFAEEVSESYGERVVYSAVIREDRLDDLGNELTASTNGRATIINLKPVDDE